LSIGTLFVLTLPCSAAAWVLARRAIRQIDRGETVHGAGQAQVALWVGRMGVVVGLGAMVAFIVLTLAGFDFDHLRDNLQRDLERRRDAARSPPCRLDAEPRHQAVPDDGLAHAAHTHGGPDHGRAGALPPRAGVRRGPSARAGEAAP